MSCPTLHEINFVSQECTAFMQLLLKNKLSLRFVLMFSAMFNPLHNVLKTVQEKSSTNHGWLAIGD